MRRYHVPVIPQTKPMGCWAASIAMILSWRDHKLYTPGYVAEQCGYGAMREAGLDKNDSWPLLYWGFKWLPAQTISVTDFYWGLVNHGPLWVATDQAAPGQPTAPHIRVVTGMDPHPDPGRAIIYLNDPAPLFQGSFGWETYHAFIGKKTTLMWRSMAVDAPIYTAHLAKQ